MFHIPTQIMSGCVQSPEAVKQNHNSHKQQQHCHLNMQLILNKTKLGQRCNRFETLWGVYGYKGMLIPWIKLLEIEIHIHLRLS